MKLWIMLIFFFVIISIYSYYSFLQYMYISQEIRTEQNVNSSSVPTEKFILNRAGGFVAPAIWKSITSSSLNVFFVETSCAFKLTSKPGYLHLTKRQACAIYSTAVLNPKRRIIIVHTCPLFKDYTERWMEDWPELLSLENVVLLQTEIAWLLSGTPIATLLDGRLNHSSYPIEHSSDLVRLAILYKYGGTYLDTDVVSIRPLDHLGNDYIGAQEATILANGVLNFNPTGVGHQFLEDVLSTLPNSYEGSQWSANGPSLITDRLRKFCQLDPKQPLDKVGKLHCGINIHPPAVFYPIPYWEWNLFLDDNTWPKVKGRIENTYILHFWNKLSKDKKVHIGSHQPYGLIAANYCTPIYFKSGEVF